MFRILGEKLFSHSISEGISPLSSSFQQLLWRGPITCGYSLTLILFPLGLVEFSLSPVCSKRLQSHSWERFTFIHLETHRSAQGNFIEFFLKNFSSFHFLCPLFLELFSQSEGQKFRLWDVFLRVSMLPQSSLRPKSQTVGFLSDPLDPEHTEARNQDLFIFISCLSLRRCSVNFN